MNRKGIVPPQNPSTNHDADGLDFDPKKLEPETPRPAAPGNPDADSPGPARPEPGLDFGTELGADDSDPAPDPFDPANYVLDQDFSEAVGVQKVLTVVPVRKPDKSWFVRAHPDPKYRMRIAVIELKDLKSDIYLVTRNLWIGLSTEPTFKTKQVVLATTRQGVPFLWETNIRKPDGRVDEWSRTAVDAIKLATDRWVRVVANMTLGGYEVFRASGEIEEPKWPTESMQDLVRIAFKERIINDYNHPILRDLRGETRGVI